MTPSYSLEDMPYAGYSYAYPHKTAYRPLNPKPLLSDVWRGEDLRSLFLYVHVPFCEMRCGFCNLFTQVRGGEELTLAWLRTLEREAELVREALGPDARFVRFALGGGTPTQLPLELLARVLNLAEGMGTKLSTIPGSAETSPETAHPEKLSLLRSHGIGRISIGVQSFHAEELRALGRPQRTSDVETALRAIRDLRFPTLNVDLIYGIEGQTGPSLQSSIDRALEFRPEELYLYPLYIRPLTGLGKRGDQAQDEHRKRLYVAGRDHLLERGYEQVSMRMFRRAGVSQLPGPAYCCQRDGMVGLGPGARSYTRALHYSSDYAVGQTGVREIIAGYGTLDDDALKRAQVGFVLNEDEQMRRFVIQSLLSEEGLSADGFSTRFGVGPWSRFPQLADLVERAFATRDRDDLRLTPAGYAHSDAIGPWLYSEAVNAKMVEYEAR